jgi:pimeloyl-ACP methyl ester carboxylesterase
MARLQVVATNPAGASPVTLEVDHDGAGGRPLMLVHGFTGAKEDFTPWLAPLAELGWHAASPDLRGHGASSQPADEAAYSLRIMADDVRDCAKALGWDSFTLLGHSMGGMIAHVIAIDTPELLDSLVLMDTCHGPVPGLSPELVELGIAIVRDAGMAGYHAVVAEGTVGSNSADLRLREQDPKYAEWCDHKLLTSSPAMFCALAAEFSVTPDRTESLRSLTVPTQVMCGTLDEWMRPPSEHLAATIIGAQLALLDEGGHCPQFESPDAWWSALTGFLDRQV